MKFEHWYISNNRGEDCSCRFTEYERAIFWRKYLQAASPKDSPYMVYGFVVDEKGKMV